jgi:hypothetical protein
VKLLWLVCRCDPEKEEGSRVQPSPSTHSLLILCQARVGFSHLEEGAGGGEGLS